MGLILLFQIQILQDPMQAVTACYAAAVGATSLGLRVQCFGSTAIRRAGAALLVSGWCALKFCDIAKQVASGAGGRERPRMNFWNKAKELMKLRDMYPGLVTWHFAQSFWLPKAAEP